MVAIALLLANIVFAAYIGTTTDSWRVNIATSVVALISAGCLAFTVAYVVGGAHIGIAAYGGFAVFVAAILLPER